MAENEELKKLLWMFRLHPPEAEPGEVRVDPVDAIYHLQKNTRNPYLKRAIAPLTQKREDAAEPGKSRVRKSAALPAYEVSPANLDAPFLRRSLTHPAPPPATKREYLDPDKLSGDAEKLPWMIYEFFRSILSRLREDPGEFDAVVQELIALFRDSGVKIKLYEAYYNFENWDQLLDTLDEVSHYPSPETFDLFCSALLTYYELVYPPEEG